MQLHIAGLEYRPTTPEGILRARKGQPFAIEQ